MGHKYLFLQDIVSGPNVIHIKEYKLIKEYLLNGFACIYDSDEILVCEVKGDLYRAVSTPTAETSVNGPKDSFNESILMNLGLIKRRIKTDKLINEDFMLGRKTLTKVSLLYCNDIVKDELVDLVRDRLNNIDIDGIIDSGYIRELIEKEQKSLFPKIISTERPDLACTSLLDGKIIILVENSPFILILPAVLNDFFKSPQDEYQK
jgi:hypothetical protein